MRRRWPKKDETARLYFYSKSHVKNRKNWVLQKTEVTPDSEHWPIREKFKTLHAKVKKLLRESRKHFYDSIDTCFKEES